MAGGEYNRIATIYDNSVTFGKPFENEVVDTGIIPKTVLYLVTVDMSVRYNDEVENDTRPHGGTPRAKPPPGR